MYLKKQNKSSQDKKYRAIIKQSKFNISSTSENNDIFRYSYSRNASQNDYHLLKEPEHLLTTRSRHIISRNKTPLNLFIEPDDRLNYFTKKNQTFRGRDRNNIRKIKDSSVKKFQNSCNHNENVVNILNGGDHEKNVEINFNKYEIKILSDKNILKKDVAQRNNSAIARKNVNTIINTIQKEKGTNINTIQTNTSTIPIIKRSESNEFHRKKKKSSSLKSQISITTPQTPKKILLKKSSTKSRNNNDTKESSKIYYTVSNEINILYPKNVRRRKDFIPCNESSIFFTSVTNDPEDISLRDHYSVSSHFGIKRNCLTKQSSKRTSTFTTEAENNYFSSGGVNSNENDEKKFKKIQKHTLEAKDRDTKKRPHSVREHQKETIDKSYDEISSIEKTKGDKKDDDSIKIQDSFEHSIESNCFKESEKEEEEKKALIGRKNPLHRASTISITSTVSNAKRIKDTIDKPLSNEIKALKFNLRKSQTKKTIKANKKFLRQLSRISEISSKNKRNSQNTVNTYTSINKKLSQKNNSVCFHPNRNEDYSLSISLDNEKNKSFDMNINNNFKLITEDILNQLQKNSKIIQEENGSSTISRNEDDDSQSDCVKKSISKKASKLRSDTVSKLSKNLSRTNSINIFELGSIKITKKDLVYQNEPQSEENIKFIQKINNEMLDKLTMVNETSSEEKEAVLNKIMLILDIKSNKLEEKRKNTIHQCSSKAIGSFSLSSLEETILPCIYNSASIDDEILFENILRRNKKNLVSDNSKEINKYLVNQYFEVNLFSQIIINGYTDTDIVQLGNEYPLINTLIKNFTMKKKAFNRQRTSIGIKHHKINTLRPNKQITKEYVSEGNYNSKYYNYFIIADSPINDLNQEKDDFDIPKINSLMEKPSQSSSFFKNSMKSRKKITTKNFEPSQTRRSSKYFYKKSTLSMSNSIRCIDNNNNNKIESSILNRNFYNRVRDVLGNLDFDKLNNQRMTLENLLKKQRQQLFISPFKRIRDSSPLYQEEDENQNEKPIFNKETMMYKTHEIKSEMLKECSNVKDSLFFYIKDGNYQNFIELFSKFKINIENKDKNGNTYLNLAVQCDNETIVLYLLGKGANVNTQNKKQNTPLHYALSYQNFTICDMLLRSGADESVKNYKGLTPWQCLDTKYSIV